MYCLKISSSQKELAPPGRHFFATLIMTVLIVIIMKNITIMIKMITMTIMMTTYVFPGHDHDHDHVHKHNDHHDHHDHDQRSPMFSLALLQVVLPPSIILLPCAPHLYSVCDHNDYEGSGDDDYEEYHLDNDHLARPFPTPIDPPANYDLNGQWHWSNLV